MAAQESQNGERAPLLRLPRSALWEAGGACVSGHLGTAQPKQKVEQFSVIEPALRELLKLLAEELTDLGTIPVYTEAMLKLSSEGAKFRAGDAEAVQMVTRVEQAAFYRTEEAVSLLHQATLAARHRETIYAVNDQRLDVAAFCENAKMALRRNPELFGQLNAHDARLQFIAAKLVAREWWCILGDHLARFKDLHRPAKDLVAEGAKAIKPIGKTVIALAATAAKMKDNRADSADDEARCSYAVTRLNTLASHFHFPENRGEGGEAVGRSAARAAARILELLPPTCDSINVGAEAKHSSIISWGYEILSVQTALGHQRLAGPNRPVAEEEEMQRNLKKAIAAPPGITATELRLEWGTLQAEAEQGLQHFRGALRGEHIAAMKAGARNLATTMEGLAWRSVEAAQSYEACRAACAERLLRQEEGRVVAVMDFKTDTAALVQKVAEYTRAKAFWGWEETEPGVLKMCTQAISGAHILITEAQMMLALVDTAVSDSMRAETLRNVDTLRVARDVPESAVPGSVCLCGCFSLCCWCARVVCSRGCSGLPGCTPCQSPPRRPSVLLSPSSPPGLRFLAPPVAPLR